jgi:hypothetical protein
MHAMQAARMAGVALSFAKTGAALLSVTIATVAGVGRADGRGGWHGWRSEATCGSGARQLQETCTAQPTKSRQAARRS